MLLSVYSQALDSTLVKGSGQIAYLVQECSDELKEFFINLFFDSSF